MQVLAGCVHKWQLTLKYTQLTQPDNILVKVSTNPDAPQAHRQEPQGDSCKNMDSDSYCTAQCTAAILRRQKD